MDTEARTSNQSAGMLALVQAVPGLKLQPTSVDLGLEDPMNWPLLRSMSVEALGVLGFTGSLMVNVDPLPATQLSHLSEFATYGMGLCRRWSAYGSASSGWQQVLTVHRPQPCICM